SVVPVAEGPRIALSGHAATFLSSEQFSLMSARNLGYNESFNRVSMFLTTLSASAVALALVADASGFDGQFAVFALVLFPIVLFLGIATHARLVQISLEDVHLVAALNRLRRAYVDGAPEIRPYLTTGVSDDEVGVWTTYLLGRPSPQRHWHQVIVNVPTTLATLNAVIAATGVGALAKYFDGAGTVVFLSCVATFLTVASALFSLQLRAYRTARENEPRFPSDE
ncbi:MAG: hypothetical protein ACRD1T_18745, partial [Acidimicrobiia bacterium]